MGPILYPMPSHHPGGWIVRHRDVIRYESSGNVRLTLKVQSYAEYRQGVKVLKIPEGFKIMKKGVNRFLLHKTILGRSGIIPVKREYRIVPIPVYFPPELSWGRIGDIPEGLRRKYKPQGIYWNAEYLRDVKDEEWFDFEDIKKWVFGLVKFLRERIEMAEPQKERLGAEKAYRERRGDCDEFTDLLITIARMRGIPARRLTGYYMGRREEPHAWAEILTPKGWLPVDAALLRVGEHTPNYIVMKVEEFNPSIGEFRFHWKGGRFRYEIERSVRIEKTD